MNGDRKLQYSLMQGFMNGEQATSLAAPGEPCHDLIMQMREQSVHAMNEGATPEEVIGMIRLESMRLEQMLLNSMLDGEKTVKEMVEENLDTEE